jgi:hypothetical protein
MEKLKIQNRHTIFKPGEGRQAFKDLSAWLRKLVIWDEKNYTDIASRVNRNMGLEGSATWNPGSIANGGEEAKEVTVTSAVLGDFAMASFSLDVEDLALNADVTDDDTVTCILANSTGGAVNLGSGTLRVRVIKK